MQKDAIVDLLEDKHQDLFDFLNEHHPERWEAGPEGKWTTGQHIVHLLESAKFINTALSMPKFVLKYKYGKANRPVRDYTTVINRYQERLSTVEPGTTFGPTSPKKVPPLKDKDYLMDRLKMECKKLQYKTKKWKDTHLDTYIVPHPLMGKMPVREMIMWSAYHVQLHTETLKEKY